MTLADEITKFANEPDEKGETMDPESEYHSILCRLAFKLRKGDMPEFLVLEFLQERFDYPNVKNPKIRASDL